MQIRWDRRLLSHPQSSSNLRGPTRKRNLPSGPNELISPGIRISRNRQSLRLVPTSLKRPSSNRRRVTTQVESFGIPAFPQLLGTHVRGCLLREKEQNPTCDLITNHVTAALEAARDQGGPALAAQAAEALSSYGDYDKVGSVVPAILSPVSWDGGYGTLEWQYGTWQTIDFGDELLMHANFLRTVSS